jgi:hypothetical protein
MGLKREERGSLYPDLRLRLARGYPNQTPSGVNLQYAKSYYLIFNKHDHAKNIFQHKVPSGNYIIFGILSADSRFLQAERRSQNI